MALRDKPSVVAFCKSLSVSQRNGIIAALRPLSGSVWHIHTNIHTYNQSTIAYFLALSYHTACADPALAILLS